MVSLYSICRGPLQHDNTAKVEMWSDFELIKDTHYFTLTGELWVFYCEYLSRDIAR